MISLENLDFLITFPFSIYYVKILNLSKVPPLIFKKQIQVCFFFLIIYENEKVSGTTK